MIRILKTSELVNVIAAVRESYAAANWPCSVVCTSGGFDPLHLGHLHYIKDASRLGNIWISIVNGDGFLQRKKGYVFMPEWQRASIVGGLKYVHYVTIWDDGTQFVDGAIRMLGPDIFAKGGDRSSIDSIAKQERLACTAVDCRLVLGVGGYHKEESSSELLRRQKINQAS